MSEILRSKYPVVAGLAVAGLALSLAGCSSPEQKTQNLPTSPAASPSMAPNGTKISIQCEGIYAGDPTYWVHPQTVFNNYDLKGYAYALGTTVKAVEKGLAGPAVCSTGVPGDTEQLPGYSANVSGVGHDCIIVGIDPGKKTPVATELYNKVIVLCVALESSPKV